MKLPSDDDNSSLEDDASVSDFNLPGHAPDDEEQIALVATSDVNVHVSQKGSFEGSSQKTTSPFSSKERSNQRRKRCFLGLVAVVVVALSMVLATRMAGEAAEESNEELSDELSLLSESESAEYSESGSESSASSQGSLLNQVVCPLEPPPTSDNDKPGNFDEYIKADKTKLTEKGALAESTENYRNEVYDGFGLPYEQAKADISNYITEYFVPPLRRNGGGSIYESACGTAANLLMTLEIIAENGVKDVTVYGSEYLADSVTIARQMLEAHMPDSFHMGSICQADSTNLEHVPSDSIDVVFTGYIDPLVDPLGLHPGDDTNTAKKNSIARCESANEEDHGIAEREQRAQEEWFARWVTEMVRITKPGGSVIIEDVAKPICEIKRDWGGVSQTWWAIAIAKYGWDIDVDSISIEPGPRNLKKYKGRRYNVAMRKLGSL